MYNLRNEDRGEKSDSDESEGEGEDEQGKKKTLPEVQYTCNTPCTIMYMYFCEK